MLNANQIYLTLILMFPTLNSRASFIQGTIIPDSRPVSAQSFLNASRNSSSLVHTAEFWYYQTVNAVKSRCMGIELLPLELSRLQTIIMSHSRTYSSSLRLTVCSRRWFQETPSVTTAKTILSTVNCWDACNRPNLSQSFDASLP